MPAVLQRLIRHAEIATTMKYYVTMDADSVTDELWGKDGDSGNSKLPVAESGNTLGNTSPSNGQKMETAPADESTEAIERKDVTSGGHGIRTRNPVTRAPHFQCGR